MRAFLLALALALLPAAASAQSAAGSQTLSQQTGNWVQQLAAAQQPVADAYQLCRPAMARVGDALRAQERIQRGSALEGELRVCLANMRDAAAQSRDAMRALPPMPPRLEQMLGIDAAQLTKRAIAAINGSVGYLALFGEAFDAIEKDDLVTARSRLAEARTLAGSTIDGQILLLEMLRETLPLRSHKAMMDIRLAIAHAERALLMAQSHAEGSPLARQLAAIRGQASDAALRLRADWASESASLRKVAKQTRDPGLSAQLAALDRAFGGFADVGDALAALLAPADTGTVSEADGIRMLDGAALLELRGLDLVKQLAPAFSKQVR